METRQLQKSLRGSVLTVFDPAFRAAHDALLWNGRKPAARAQIIVRAADAGDVQTAVRFAAEHGLTVSPRGGGHHFSGVALAGDMIIDLAALDRLDVDAIGRRAWAGPAVTNARMATALGELGLAFPLGHCGSVPMSGYLLGGGVGWNSGAWGIACFSIEEAEVVMADGSLICASETENPEVFWALRGSGPGFFGIVTAYKLRLQSLPKAITTAVRIYPVERVDEVSAWVKRAMAAAPAHVEFTLKLCATPPGAPEGTVAAALATVFAETEAEAHEVLWNIGMGAPADAIEVIPAMPTGFDVLYGLIAESTPVGKRYAVDTLWSDADFASLANPIGRQLAAAPSRDSLALVCLRSPKAVAPTGAAFSSIGQVFGAVYAIWDEEAEDARNLSWLRDGMREVAPLCSGRYVGEADLEGSDVAHLSDEVSARLARLRSHYDPQGRFTTGIVTRPAWSPALAS